jgi:hypothetical protein
MKTHTIGYMLFHEDGRTDERTQEHDYSASLFAGALRTRLK